MVSAKIGVPREEIARLRTEHLVEGDDWRSRGREICLTPAGMKKIVELVQPKKEKDAPTEGSAPQRQRGASASEAPSPEADTPETVLDDSSAKKERAQVLQEATRMPEMLRCTKKCRNPRLLFAEFVDDTRIPMEVRVRVRDAKSFSVGTIFPAFRERDDFYVFEGKPPRNGRMR